MTRRREALFVLLAVVMAVMMVFAGVSPATASPAQLYVDDGATADGTVSSYTDSTRTLVATTEAFAGYDIGDAVEFISGTADRFSTTIATKTDNSTVTLTDAWGSDFSDGTFNLVDLDAPSSTDPFRYIQSAIHIADTGDTVTVLPGKYDENLIIEKSLTLQSTSDDPSDTQIDPPVDSIVRIAGDVDVTVQGFDISGGSYGIFVSDPQSTVNILDCFIHGNSDDGIHVAGVDETDSITIEGNRIYENGDEGIDFGDIAATSGTVAIRNNVIGGWTYYPADYGQPGAPQRYLGNTGEGIYIFRVGAPGTVAIEGNQISENAIVTIDTGIYINDLYGEVSIASNDIGAWTDGHGETYLGNAGDGVYIHWVYSGAILTIGPDNNIKENTDDGIEIFNAQPAGAATVTVEHNTIDNNGSDGVELGTPGEVDGATISYNAITNNHEKGIFLTGPSDYNVISHNEIRGNGHGIWIERGGNNLIMGNNIVNNRALDSGIHLEWQAYDNVINWNNIEGNIQGVVKDESIPTTADAKYNWWGDPSGPSGEGPGTGDAVSMYVSYEPWLTVPIYGFPVGGEVYPIDKTSVLGPWIGLALIVMAATIAGMSWFALRRRRVQS